MHVGRKASIHVQSPTVVQGTIESSGENTDQRPPSHQAVFRHREMSQAQSTSSVCALQHPTSGGYEECVKFACAWAFKDENGKVHPARPASSAETCLWQE